MPVTWKDLTKDHFNEGVNTQIECHAKQEQKKKKKKSLVPSINEEMPLLEWNNHVKRSE